MSDVTRVSVEIGGTEISFETGKLAKQASGSVVVQQGDTVVLSTATAGNQRDVDFLPLTVDVEERMYAAGKIPGSFFKREGRAGEKGTLVARMIDRPLRPLFPKGWNYETQLVTVPLSIDHANPYDILGMNGASAALMVSDIPFPEPVGAVRIGKVDGNFVVNPTEDVIHEGKSDLDLVVSGTAEAILMVEAGANEIPEAEILDALDIAHGAIKKLVAAMNELGEKAGKKDKIAVSAPVVPTELIEQVSSEFGGKLDEATQVFDKLERQNATKALRDEVIARFTPEEGTDDYAAAASNASVAFDKLEKQVIRQRIAVQKKRPDGRDTTEIRPISVEAGLLPRTHGSALFTRGQTQALSVVALGTSRENMRLDTLGLETEKWYFHHYNFPPFSVGEAGFMRGPKRRDIGHGALAERALVPMIPTQEDFPYTIRIVSDILESNGSSSMASVCGSTLSLMDAGVPIKAPVAGIAMGLIKEGDDYVVLTDIAGVEDHLGDMDFKVAGTEAGITALQMDIKITGVTFDILRDALAQAKEARTFILGEMAKVIDRPARADVGLRAAHLVHQDRSGQDRPADRQGRRDDPLAPGGVRGPDRRRRHRPGARLRRHRRAGRRPRRPHPRHDQGGRDRRHVPGQGRQDHAVRRVHRARQGHGRPAAHLQRRPGRAPGDGRGGAREGPGPRGPRGRGRPRARPHRPAPRRRPRGRRQGRFRARRRRLGRPWPAPRGGGGDRGDRGPRRESRGGDRGGRGGDRGGRGRDRDRGGDRGPRRDNDPDRG